MEVQRLGVIVCFLFPKTPLNILVHFREPGWFFFSCKDLNLILRVFKRAWLKLLTCHGRRTSSCQLRREATRSGRYSPNRCIIFIACLVKQAICLWLIGTGLCGPLGRPLLTTSVNHRPRSLIGSDLKLARHPSHII